MLLPFLRLPALRNFDPADPLRSGTLLPGADHLKPKQFHPDLHFPRIPLQT